jgi:release factor glutamine methyltransferase
VRIVTLPGVFAPISDTWLLADCVRTLGLDADSRVLDACTGSGALAIAAAQAGAGHVTAIDVSRRAVATARLNARLNRVSLRTLRGDLLDRVRDERFDAILSNPPYLPAEDDELPRRGRARAWDAGRDGRALLDRLCREAPARLRPGGVLLLVHSSVSGEHATLAQLRGEGLEAEVVVRRPGPLGPRLAARARTLQERGQLPPGSREEELLVIRGRAPALGAAAA